MSFSLSLYKYSFKKKNNYLKFLQFLSFECNVVGASKSFSFLLRSEETTKLVSDVSLKRRKKDK